MTEEELRLFAEALAAQQAATAEEAQKNKTLDETVGGKPWNWQDAVIDGLNREMVALAKDLGFNQDLMEGLVLQHSTSVIEFVGNTLFTSDNPSGQPIIPGGEPWSASAFQNAMGLARTVFGNRTGLGTVMDMDLSSLNAGGGGGGGGATRMTPEQIRQSFDIDALSRKVTEKYQGMLFDEPGDPRGIARSYVEAIVANPDQKLDFEAFVERRIEKEPRYASIYRHKPAAMTAGQFMAPYLNTAQQVLRPQNAGEVARAGAQMGASNSAFTARLGRSREAQTSAPFITGMENRITDLGKLFKTQ